MTEAFDDLSWGSGPRLLEVFVEPTCPHSGRAFGKLGPLIDKVGHDRLTVRFWLNEQPWHIFSTVVGRAVLAASGTEGGRETAFAVMRAVFAHREDFILEAHSTGPNLDASPAEILRRIARHSGHDLRAAFGRTEVTDVIKRHTRYCRQNGIHVTPTFMVDGLVDDGMGSRDEIDQWIERIGA